jgi:predicted esterase
MEVTEKSIKTTKTARFYQLGDCGPQTKHLWIVLHGYGQLASYFIKHFAPIADAHTCVVAPEGLSRFYLDNQWDRVGATWMTKEDRLHEIADYIEYLDRLLETMTKDLTQMPEITLLGFSQGTATAWRWMMKGDVRPQQLILWAGGIAGDTMEKAAERLKNCTVNLVLGDSDQYIRTKDAEKQLATLQAIQSNAKLWTFVGDHRMDAETLLKLKENTMANI